MLADLPRWIAYLASAGLIATASLVKFVVDQALRIDSDFAFYMVAIAVVAWAFGRGPGWFSVFLAAAAFNFYFTGTAFTIGFASRPEWLRLLVLMLAAGAIVEVLRFAVRSRHDARRFSQLAIETKSRMEHAMGSLTEPFAIVAAVRNAEQQVIDYRIDYINKHGIEAIRLNNPAMHDPEGRLMSEISREFKLRGVFDAYVNVMESGEPYNQEVCVQAEDSGKPRWIELHASKFDDGVIVQWRNTSERHRAEEVIRKSENRYRSLVQASSAIVWCADTQGNFVDPQPKWSAFTGQSDAESRLTGWLAAIHPDQRENFRKNWEQSVASRAMLEESVRVRRFDGEFRVMQVRAVPILDETGNATEWIGTYTDITERMLAEEALRKSENRFRRLYESNQLGVMFYHADGTVTDPNDVLLDMLGITREAFKRNGLNWRRITPHEWEETDRVHWECLQLKGTCGPFEKEYLHSDGTRVPVLIAGANLEPDNHESGVACVVDLSKSKRVEGQLRQSQRDLIALTESLELRVIERTAEADHRSQQLRALALDLAETESRERKRLARLLHDHFQQLISAAKLKAGLVRRGAVEPKMIESIRQIESLLEEAIAASRSLATELSPPVLSVGGLEAAVQWLARKMEKDHGLIVEVACDPAAEPEGEQVRTLLFECVRELLFNIVKHAETRQASLTTRLSGEGLLQIIIEDHGRGFEFQAAMRRSMTAGEDGTFGIFSIRERLSLIGGLLNIHSKPGEGTRVELSIPVGLKKPVLLTPELSINGSVNGALTTPEKHPHPNGKSVHYDAKHPARVVVADDHRLFREGLINLLSQEPTLSIIGEASDGQEAVELCGKLRPDLLICDVTMPKLNGVQVTKQVSREFPEIRIIGLSMHEREDMADAMRAAGAVAYVTKSGPSDQLLSVIRQVTLNQPLEPI